MKKIGLKLIASICVLTMIMSTLCIFHASAGTISYTKTFAKYDFEDGKDYLDFAIPNNSYNKDSDGDGVIDGAKVEIITENEGTENENSYLRLQGLCASTTGVIVNFPYELENGATYTISYKIKDDGLSYIAQNAKAAGIYVGKATGKSELSTYAQMNTKNYGHEYADRLACIYDDWNGNTSVQYVKIGSENFIQVTKTFTVSEDTVNDEFKYLQFYYYPKTAASSTEKWEYIDIDEIVITKMTTDSYVNDFEDGTVFLDFGINNNLYGKDFDEDGNIDGAFVSVMTENEGAENENTYLRIQNRNYNDSIVNFPFILENGATYNISYKLRDDGASKLGQPEGSGAGFYIGKSTGKTVMDATAQIGVSNFLGKKMCNLYGDNGSYVALNKSEFVDVSFTFTVGEEDVDDQFKYLALNYYCKETSGSKYDYIDIDDICIRKAVTLSFDTNGGNTIEDMVIGCGETITVIPEKDGFEFVGWYDVDGNYVSEKDGVITAPEKDATYYAQWKEATDLDDNGVWDAGDLIVLRKILLGTVTDYSQISADINEDGIVDVLDLVRLKKIVAGVVLPVELETTPILSATYKSANETLSNLFDNDLTTYTISPESSKSASGKSIIVNLNGSFNVSSIRLWKNSLGGFPTDFHINILDGDGWSTVYTAKDVSLNRKYMNVTINKSCAAIEIVADTMSLMTDTSKYAISFAEMKVYGESTDSVFPADDELTTLENNPEGNLIQNTLSTGCEISTYDYGKTNATTQNYIFLPAGSIISSTKNLRVAFYDDDYIWQPSWDIYKKRTNCDPETRKEYRVVEDSYCRISISAGFDKTTEVSSEELLAAYNTVTFKVPTDRVNEVYSSDPEVDVLAKYTAEIESTENAVSQIKYENGVRYAFITDLHANMTAGMRQLNAIVTMVEDLNLDEDTYNDIDFVCLGGDITTGMYATKEAYWKKMQEILAPLKDLSVPVIILMGNHDDNSYYYMCDWVDNNSSATDDEKNAVFNDTVVTKLEWKAAFNNTYGAKVDLVYNNDDVNSNYYYFDIASKKTRVICLDSIDYGIATTKYNGFTLYGYGIKQIKWLAEKALTADSDWKYIFLSHMEYEKRVFNSSLTKIKADECSLNMLIYACQNNGEFNYTDGTVTVSRNFADSPTGKICSYQFGHVHADLQLYNEELNLAYLLTGTSGQFTYGAAEHTVAEGNIKNAIAPLRKKGKISEALFDITTVSDSAVNVIRFGAIAEGYQKNTTYTIK